MSYLSVMPRLEKQKYNKKQKKKSSVKKILANARVSAVIAHHC